MLGRHSQEVDGDGVSGQGPRRGRIRQWVPSLIPYLCIYWPHGTKKVEDCRNRGWKDTTPSSIGVEFIITKKCFGKIRLSCQQC